MGSSGASYPAWVEADLLTSGEESIPRDNVNSTLLAPGGGNLLLAYWTARRTETIRQLRVITGNTAASAATLCRMGIYSISGGTGTLVASTPNDTALFAATFSGYAKALSVNWGKTVGRRYAFGVLAVASIAPSFTGEAIQNGYDPTGYAPILCGILTGQSDLPATYSEASLATSGYRLYGLALP